MRGARSRAIAGGAVALSCWLAACSSGPVGAPGPASRAEAARADEIARARAASVLDAPRVRKLRSGGWVEVDAAVLASDDEAPAAARRRAIARARQAAVEHVAGVNVKSSLLSLDQLRDGTEGSLLQVLSASRSDALVIDEELVSTDVMRLATGGYRVDVTLRAQVLDHAKRSDGRFRAEVKLNRKTFRDGEDVELSVRVSKDARIYVVGVTDDGAAMLIPSRHMPDTIVEGGTWLHFPDARLKERGVRLTARLPEGREHAEEALIVLAVRGGHRLESPMPASGASFATASEGAASGMLGVLLEPLAHIPPRDWTFDQLVYGIYAR